MALCLCSLSWAINAKSSAPEMGDKAYIFIIVQWLKVKSLYSFVFQSAALNQHGKDQFFHRSVQQNTSPSFKSSPIPIWTRHTKWLCPQHVHIKYTLDHFQSGCLPSPDPFSDIRHWGTQKQTCRKQQGWNSGPSQGFTNHPVLTCYFIYGPCPNADSTPDPGEENNVHSKNGHDRPPACLF